MGSVDDFMEAEMKHKLEEESKIIGGLATLEKNGGMTIDKKMGMLEYYYLDQSREW